MPKNVKFWELEEWDNLVKYVYKKRYSFQQQDGIKERGVFIFTAPDCCLEEDPYPVSIPVKVDVMGVSFATWLTTPADHVFNPEWAAFKNEIFWEENFYPHVYMIIQDLYKRGLISEGDHVINIDW